MQLPSRFGRYVLFDRIGQGGMAEIYLARQTTELGAERLFVVKVILPVYADRPEFAEMLVKEAKLAATLTHANIVQVVDLGRESENGNRLYIAMEYVEGLDLAALLKRCSKDKIPLPPEFALYFVIELLAGLDYAHRKKEQGRALDIVHRDVSPTNILVSLDGEVKLCDFGIARANDLATGKDEEPSEAIKGKAGYMSPEHARGDVIDARADVFAAGIVLWELLAGRKLYRGGDLISQARGAMIPALESRGLAEEERLFAIVKKALAPKADDRYRSAADMRRELDAYAKDAKLAANPIKLGEWMSEHFGADLLEQRRTRERAAKALAPTAIVAKALRTPPPPEASVAPRITFKEEPIAEPVPESLTPMDISPTSQRPEPSLTSRSKGPPWPVLAIAAAVVGVVAWLLSR